MVAGGVGWRLEGTQMDRSKSGIRRAFSLGSATSCRLATLAALFLPQGGLGSGLAHSTSWAPEPLGRLDLRYVGPAKGLLAEISKRTGVEARIVGAISNEPLIVGVSDGQLVSTLSEVAHSLDAECRKTDYGYLIERPPALARQLDQKDHGLRAALLTRSLADIKRTARSALSPYDAAKAVIGDFVQDYKDINDGTAERSTVVTDHGYEPKIRLPADDLLRSILGDLGADRLASIPYIRRAPFSTHPATSAETDLGSHGPALKRFFETEQWLGKLMESDRLDVDVDWWQVVRSASLRADGNGKAVVLSSYFGDALSFVVGVYDGSGSQLSNAVVSLPVKIKGPGPIDLTWFPQRTAELSALSKEFAKATSFIVFGSVTSVAAWYGFSPEIRTALKVPDAFEPFEFCAAEGVLGLGDSAHRNVVARLPDSALNLAATACKNGQIDLIRFANSLTGDGAVELSRDAEWLLLKPIDSIDCERRRLDRQALARYMGRATKEPALTLRSVCQLMYEGGVWAAGNPVLALYDQILPGFGVRLPRLRLPFQAAWLLGSLDDLTWARLEQGGSIDVGLLGPDQRSWFEDWAARGIGICERMPGQEFQSIPDQMLLGPEAMPNGTHAGCLLSMNAGLPFEAQLVPTGDESVNEAMPSGVPLRADNVASIVRDQLRSGAAKTISEALKGTWRPVARRSIEITGITLPGVVAKATWIGATTSDGSEPAVPFDKLPKEYIDAVLAEIRKAK